MSEPVYVGIDVAKSTFEVAATGAAQTLSLGNDDARLCQLLAPLAPRLVLLEATGGYEQHLALALSAAGARLCPLHGQTGQDRSHRCAGAARLCRLAGRPGS